MYPEQENSVTFKKVAKWSLFYFAPLALIIIAVNVFNIPLATSGGGIFAFPTTSGWFYVFFYWLFPLVLTIFFSLRYRPFIKNFLCIILFIFAVHLAYSVVMFSLTKLSMQVQTESAQIKFNSLSHEISVSKGYADLDFYLITLTGNLYYPHKNPIKDGDHYFIFTYPQQPVSDGKILFERKISDIALTNNPENINNFSQTFSLSSARKNTPIILDMELRKEIKLGFFGVVLSRFCGASAFLCKDLWENYEPKFYPIPIGNVYGAYTFFIQ